MEFWQCGSLVTDDPKALLKWVKSLPAWGETAHEGEDDEAEAAEDAAEACSASEEKARLAALRVEVEQLEAKKALLVADDEHGRKLLQVRAAEKHALLEASVKQRISELASLESDLVGLAQALGLPPGVAKHGCVGPHCGRDAALAFAWWDVNREQVTEEAKPCLLKHLQHVKNEIEFLEQMLLAAKVVTHVTSPTHKKLLNLCHQWLATFLPHCLAKINRVSFGLLTVEDCKAALEADPFVPRSRLKLAVPFIGKDVPSKSSEFAHPDVIIGLTILAYRYSGVRHDDYVDVIDSLTAQFSREIGPARDRDSSCRHEKWVHAAGGAIRGLKTTRDGDPWDPSAFETNGPNGSSTNKEVVQLKFLQKSNVEQMDKLFALLRTEPLVIHDYLQKSIFPLYMRSQKMKISASGQAVGGNMLVGRRVG